MNQLKSGKFPEGYAEMLKAGGAVALLWLHTLLYSIWNTGIIPTGWRRGVVTLSGRERVTPRSVTTTEGLPSSVPGRILARILLDRVK